MGSDAELIAFLERSSNAGSPDHTGDVSQGDSVPETADGIILLRQALIRNLPMIRRKISANPQLDSSLHDYLKSLYDRLRRRLRDVDDLDHAIDNGINSLLHEQHRNLDRRSFRVKPLGADAVSKADPDGLRFVTALISQDKLKAFMELLDPWTKNAFIAIHLEGDGEAGAAVARRLGMRENSFQRKFRRGIDKAKERYISLHGRV